MNAINPETKEQLVDAKLQVHLSTGEVLDMAYGQHAEDHFWTVNYPITEETPKGQLDYFVTAEYNGTTTEYRPFNVAPSMITIIDPSAKVEEAAVEEPEVDLSSVTTNQNIELIGKNFTFTNPAGEDTFYVKAGNEVTINYKSEEGMHGFDIEGLGVSVEKSGTIKFTPTEAGEFSIVCNMFCGAGHENMKSKLVVINE